MRRAVISAALVLLVGAGTASAASFTLTAGSSVTFGYSGPGGASATATFSLGGTDSLGRQTFSITLTNNGSGFITGLGFDSTPTLDDGTPPDLRSSGFDGELGADGWVFNPNGALGLGNYEIRMGNEGGVGLLAGEGGTFHGYLTSSVNSLNIDGSIVHIQGLSIPGGSIKPEGVPVPEPVSLLLFGTGLLGVGFIRRRRK